MLKFSCAKRLKDWTSRWYNFDSSKLAGSKLASFHVCLHLFQCTPDQNNRFDYKCIRWKDSLIWNIHFVCQYVFAFINLVCVQSVIQLMSTYHFCIYYKRLFHFFLRVIIVQDFETVTFYVLSVYKPTFSVIFCWIKMVRVSRKFNSLFILYISTAKPISLVGGYIEVKISKHDIW